MTENIVKSAYADGCRALERHDFADAVAAFGRGLVVNPEDPLNLHGAGIALVRLSRYAEAEKLLRRAIAAAETAYGPQYPAVASIAFGLSDLCCVLGRYDEAENICLRLLKSMTASQENPARVRVLLRLADVNRKQGRLNDAERAYLAAVAERTATFGARHPKVAEILPYLAELYREMGRPIDAADLTRRMLRIQSPQREPARDRIHVIERRDHLAPAG